MPYSLPEVQREYQRLWAANKKTKWRDQDHIGRRDLVYNSDGTMNLRKKIITWDELNADNMAKLATWGECIKKAKGFLLGRRTNKMLIAAIAIRACVIRHGGLRKSGVIEKHTLKSFAATIGINHKTLYTWVRIKKDIIDRLPKTVKFLDFTAAREAQTEFSKRGGDPVKLYEKYSTQDPFIRRSYACVRYLANAANNLTLFGTRGFTEEQLIDAYRHVSKIQKVLRGKHGDRALRNNTRIKGNI